jgi:hypothetical protein
VGGVGDRKRISFNCRVGLSQRYYGSSVNFAKLTINSSICTARILFAGIDWNDHDFGEGDASGPDSVRQESPSQLPKICIQ